jgi:hypothetical protein
MLGTEACTSYPTDYLNVILHGVFLVTPNPSTIWIQAAKIVGHSYGGRWGRQWYAFPDKPQTASLPPSQGSDAQTNYRNMAATVFPQLDLSYGPSMFKDYIEWSLVLPLPDQIRAFRSTRRGNQTILYGNSLKNPNLTAGPECLVLRYKVTDWSGLTIGGNSLMRGENLNLYAQPAFDPGPHLNHFCDCFDKPLDVYPYEGAFYRTDGPDRDPSLNIEREDTLHLYEILTQGHLIPDRTPKTGMPPGCLPFGG